MALTARTVCLMLAAALFAVSAFWTPPPSPRVGLTALGLFLVAVALLL
jgi:hypothetical protein